MKLVFVPTMNGTAVNPANVVDVKVDATANRIIITMIDGRTHSAPCAYGKSIWMTCEELVAALNGENR